MEEEVEEEGETELKTPQLELDMRRERPQTTKSRGIDQRAVSLYSAKNVKCY